MVVTSPLIEDVVISDTLHAETKSSISALEADDEDIATDMTFPMDTQNDATQTTLLVDKIK